HARARRRDGGRNAGRGDRPQEHVHRVDSRPRIHGHRLRCDSAPMADPCHVHCRGYVMKVVFPSARSEAHNSLLQGALSTHRVSKRYHLADRDLEVLRDIDLAIAPGEFVSIVGASGCGKSTLLRLIVGLDPDYTGDIVLDGERVKGTSLDRGIVFQDHRLLPWMTVQQNIELALLNSGLSRER